MMTYTIYHVAAGGRACFSFDLDAADDITALEIARRRHPTGTLEVWHAGRLATRSYRNVSLGREEPENLA